MERGIQEVIQVFCSICSRGVLVRNESMYKCKKCGREICRGCFDKEHRLCLECVKEAMPETGSRMEIFKAAQPSGIDDPKARRKQHVWMIIVGIVMFGGVLLLSVIIYIPGLVVMAVAAAGLYLAVRNMLNMLKN